MILLFQELGCQTGGSDGGGAGTSWRGEPSSPNHHRFLTVIGSMSWGSDVQYWNCFFGQKLDFEIYIQD